MIIRESLPTDLAAAHAMIMAERAARIDAEAHAARTVAENSNRDAFIAHLKLQIAKRGASSTAAALNARRGCSIRWSLSSKI